MSQRFAVIMAGGRGERFWPQSRLKRPKHLLPIIGNTPMLCQTVDRLAGLVPPENVFVITNREQRLGVLEACPNLDPAKVIGEPVGRDTAAAVGLAAILVKIKDANSAFAILPADAAIHDTEGFRATIATAFETAETGEHLVTVGIKPNNPATGYGYIQKGEPFGSSENEDVYKVSRFVEKPDLPTAEKYLESGDYFWNAGIFVWRTDVIKKALAVHTPELWRALGKVEDGISKEENLDSLLQKYYPKLEKISIDYALMEKADNVLTVQAGFDWDDVGEWPAIARHVANDSKGNVLSGRGMIREGSGNIVVNEKDHFTALIGVDDLIVVQTEDATLVCPKSKAQEIKNLVKEMENNPDLEHLL